MRALQIPAEGGEREILLLVGAPPAGRARLFFNRLVFRGMVFVCGFVAVIVHAFSHAQAWRWVRLSARALAVATGVRVTVLGLEDLPDGPSIITPNHASHFDIAALLAYLPGHNRFAAKKELFREPILGMAMKTLGMIPIDRENPAASIERLNRLEARGRDAFSLVMFPEGTRSGEEGLRPFKKGAFALALRLGRPIVPIAIHGTSGVMPPGRYLSIHPGTVVLEILPPIETRGRGPEDRDRLAEETRAAIETRLARARDAGA